MIGTGRAWTPVLVLLGVAVGLGGCGSGPARTVSVSANPAGSLGKFDREGAAYQLRSSGAKETTLAAFCKTPPKTTTPAGAEAIRVSCRPKVLKLAGDAMLFDKGKGLYYVLFKRPVKKSDICDAGVSSASICAVGILPNESFNTSRISAL